MEDIIPLNAADDPFLTLTDDQLSPDSEALREAYIVRLMVEDLSRGMYSVGRIREKYLGEGKYKPYDWMTPEKLAELLQRATDKLVTNNPLDVRFEIVGYLSSNLGLLSSLYDMLDTSIETGKIRTSVEITRTLNQLKKERLEFIRDMGQKLAEQAQDPSKPSILPPGAVAVTDLLAEGAKILERTSVPDHITGVLASGDIAESERSRRAKRKVEEQQDAVHPTSVVL